MTRWLKIIVIFLAIFIALIGSGAVYIFYNLDQIKQLALKEINKKLKSELRTESINITFWNTFPDVSLSFNHLSISDPLRKNELLLDAQHLFMGFNIYDILQKNYSIHKIEIDSAIVHLYIDKNNNANYNIIKEDTDVKNGKGELFSFNLNKLYLNNILVTYQSKDLVLRTMVQHANLSGSFNEKRFRLESYIEAHVNNLGVDNMQLLKDKHVVISTRIEMNMNEKIFIIDKSNCKIDALELQLEGVINQLKTKTNYDLRFITKKITIQDLLSILPYKLPPFLFQYKSSGKVYFNGIVKGIKSEKEQPAIDVKFGIEQGSLYDNETKIKLDEISLNGHFSNGNGHSAKTSSINLSTINVAINHQTVNGNLSILNLDQPAIKMDFKGSAEIGALSKFLKITSVEKASGALQFSLVLKGVKKSKTWDWSDAANEGKIKSTISFLKLKDLEKPLTNAAVDIHLTKDVLKVNQIDVTINKTTLHITGQISNMMDFIFGNTVKLKGNFVVNSDKIFVEDLIIYQPVRNANSNASNSSYEMMVNVDVNQITYQNFISTQFKINMKVTPDNIEFEQGTMITNGGQVKAKGSLQINQHEYVLKLLSNAKALDINELLKQFDNFGQKEITAKNLYGTLFMETELLLVWDDKLNFKEDKLLMVADITIKNGKLLNYEPLKALSRFVDVNELNNLNFSELKNILSIKNKLMTIPAMDIKNNALNLNLAGTHTLDNYLDYKIKLSLTEFLNKRRKPKSHEFEEEEEKANGMNLFITMKGTLDNIKFAYDKNAVKSKINYDLKTERQSLKEVFKKEFSINRDSTLKKTEKKNDKNDELEFEE